MAVQIKFGTDGWRAIIAREYTVDNVKRVSSATALWMRERGMKKAVIGHDCRFAGEMFAETAACVLADHGIQVLIAKDFVSTPMVSLGVVHAGADIGIVITASHNPPSYSGFKLKSAAGGPMVPAQISEVEDLIPESYEKRVSQLADLMSQGQIQYIDLEQIYYDHVEKSFDMDALRSIGGKLGYDAMYGAGQRILQRILPEAVCLHCDDNPGFKGQAPEPIERNLTELSELLAERQDLIAGLANDGDADRIGMFDENGKFVDSHHLLLLLMYYMVKIKGETGEVMITFSVTDKVKKLAEHFGLPYEVTKIGFKYIAEKMLEKDVVVGGEESGGIAIKGHIPERDGIWMGLVILELMAKTGKKLTELIQEIYDIIGPFSFDRDDLHISEDQKEGIIEACAAGKVTSIGGQEVIRTERIDGFKFYLNEDTWVMIRPSGTEPVLRVYSQAPTASDVRATLEATHETLKAIS
jgi:phosphomannomutase